MTLLDRALSRRECLKASLAGLLAPAASGWLPQLALRAGETRTSKQAKACILLWMDGGPSQIHTFNIPDKGADNRQYDTIATSVPGIHLSEHLPKLSASLKDLVIVRSMATGLNNHGAGQYLMHTGYRANQAIDYPTLGAIVARENGDRDLSLPSFINLGANGTTKPYHRAGFLGAEFAPLNLAGSSITNQRSAVDEARTADRFQLLQDVQQSALEQFRHDAVKAHLSSYERAWRLMRSDKTAALDFKKEPQAILDLYGPSGFATQCLLARRLVQAGVSFVEVNWGGWDHHGGAGEPVKKRSPELDQGMAALIQDLKQQGMLDTTLVVWMGEFGRGPKPGLGGGNNGGIGSGHFAGGWSTVLAGAGLKGGQVVGRMNADCTEITDRPVSAADFFATIAQALGIDHTKVLAEPRSRPHYVSAFGSQPLKELF